MPGSLVPGSEPDEDGGGILAAPPKRRPSRPADGILPHVAGIVPAGPVTPRTLPTNPPRLRYQRGGAIQAAATCGGGVGPGDDDAAAPGGTADAPAAPRARPAPRAAALRSRRPAPAGAGRARSAHTKVAGILPAAIRAACSGDGPAAALSYQPPGAYWRNPERAHARASTIGETAGR